MRAIFRFPRALFGGSAALLLPGIASDARRSLAAREDSNEFRRLNADFHEPVTVQTTNMTWTASPVPKVDRKRVFLYGTKESGKVTSVVRYAPNSKFHKHQHPEGEEIFVLEGIFSDNSGDYPEGTYVFNPEGFEHAPRSEDGCVIVVRLRQHPNSEAEPRAHIVKSGRSNKDWQNWRRVAHGVKRKDLYSEYEKGYKDATWLEKVQPGAIREAKVPYGWVEEVFVVDGGVLEIGGSMQRKGAWMRSPGGSSQLLIGASVHTGEPQGGVESTLYVRQFPVSMIES